MSETRIEIIALGNEKVYSVGAIVVKAKGDIYLIHRNKESDFHLSRHASGKTHWKSVKSKIFEKIGEGTPIKEFKGIESLGVSGFGIDSLPEIYTEYVVKRYDGVFCIDMRRYKDLAFNMQVYMLTEEGLPTLLTCSSLLENRQICIFPECNPMISIIVGSAKEKRLKANDAKT